MGTKRKRVTVLEGRSRRMEPSPPGPRLGDSELGVALAGVLAAQREPHGRNEDVQLAAVMSAGLFALTGSRLPDATKAHLHDLFAAERPEGNGAAHWQELKHPAAVGLYDVLVLEGHLS